MSLISLTVKKVAVTLKPLISSPPGWVKKKRKEKNFFFVVHKPYFQKKTSLMEV